jgi:hypothetical protein
VEDHLKRLALSARELGLSDQIQVGALAEAVLDTLKRSGLPVLRIRLTITGGDLNLLGRGKNGPGRSVPTISIRCSATDRVPQQMFEQGITPVIADSRPIRSIRSRATRR